MGEHQLPGQKELFRGNGTCEGPKSWERLVPYEPERALVLSKSSQQGREPYTTILERGIQQEEIGL